MGQKRLLNVGIDDAPPIPMQIGDPVSGSFRGYEVDLLEHVAKRFNCNIAYHRAFWSLIVAELKTGSLDLVCSAATVTKERTAEVSFCAPHLRLQLALVGRENAPDPTGSPTSRFGVRRGTTAEAFLRDDLGFKPSILSESNEELYSSLSEGHLDGIIDDSPIAMHFAHATTGLTYIGPFSNTEGEYAIMVAKDNDCLRNEMNDALAALETEGVLSTLREQWFGTSSILVA